MQKKSICIDKVFFVSWPTKTKRARIYYIFNILSCLSVIGMPLVVLSVVGALVLAALIIVYLVFRPRCRQQEEPNKSTMKESPEMHIVVSEYTTQYFLFCQ